ncbi:hypothetical protein WDZ11_23065 (plasmid) [Roseomonas mucosa]|uniref:hypothetical protein n=1 Tax=Roseomonas mucosa TaxID=207340 RepID=UPI000B021EB7|nr:hypothetical protein [Roseomonas mucosa]
MDWLPLSQAPEREIVWVDDADRGVILAIRVKDVWLLPRDKIPIQPKGWRPLKTSQWPAGPDEDKVIVGND